MSVANQSIFTSKMTSSSTGEPSGRLATPKTSREETASSPKMSRSSSDAASATVGALANALLLAVNPASPAAPLLRVVTGVCMAGVYPIGMKLALDIQDSGGKPETATAIVEKFITIDKYPIVVGEYTSQCSYAVAGVAEKYKVPYLVVTGAADKITQQGWKNVFRLNPPSSLYNMGVFSFFEQVAKPKSIAILYENTDFGNSTSKAMKEYCDAHGVNVVLSEGYQSGGVDFKPILQKVKSLRPDIVYMVSYLMDASLLMRQSKELDINPQAFIGGAAGHTLPEFLQNAADASYL